MQKAYDWEENYWENKPSTKTPVNKTNMDKLSNGVCTIDERVITLDLTKFDKVDAQSCIKQIAYDKATGKWTITAFSGAQQVIDTMLEKLAVNFDYDPETQRLIITLDDGTQKYADLSALITQFEFMDSDTVYWTVGAGGKVKADIKTVVSRTRSYSRTIWQRLRYRQRQQYSRQPLQRHLQHRPR